MENKKIFIAALLITFFITFFVTKKLINYLKTKSIEQKILDIGPSWHKSKEGTPTMGGISFVISSTLSFLIICLFFREVFEHKEFLLLINTFVFAVLNGLIGIIDDLAKVRKRKNEGLTPRGKLIFQSTVAAMYLAAMKFFVGMETTLYVPFFKAKIELGIFFYLFAFLLLCGVVNAVNLTDGLDGLASFTVFSVGLFLSFLGIKLCENPVVSFFGAILIGTSVAFLIFNLHPAKIFMGDTGSLFLGGIVVGSSFVINNPILVLVYGFVFILEAASVVLQVAYFKLTKGKRLFKMAPLHHHLEKCGFKESKIVLILGTINFIFCIVACFGLR